MNPSSARRSCIQSGSRIKFFMTRYSSLVLDPDTMVTGKHFTPPRYKISSNKHTISCGRPPINRWFCPTNIWEAHYWVCPQSTNNSPLPEASSNIKVSIFLHPRCREKLIDSTHCKWNIRLCQVDKLSHWPSVSIKIFFSSSSYSQLGKDVPNIRDSHTVDVPAYHVKT